MFQATDQNRCFVSTTPVIQHHPALRRLHQHEVLPRGTAEHVLCLQAGFGCFHAFLMCSGVDIRIRMTVKWDGDNENYITIIIIIIITIHCNAL